MLDHGTSRNRRNNDAICVRAGLQQVYDTLSGIAISVLMWWATPSRMSRRIRNRILAASLNERENVTSYRDKNR